MIATTAPTEEKLLEISINRIIDQAGRLSRDKDFLDVWKEVYEPAKKALMEMGLDLDSYQSALARLAEAMRV